MPRRITVRAISNLGLAHLGDGVFELMVRSWLCLHGKPPPKGLHRATVRYVAAPAQARRWREKSCRSPGTRGTCSAGAAIPAPQRAPERQPGGVPGRHRAGGPVRLAVASGEDGALNQLFAVIMEEEECR